MRAEPPQQSFQSITEVWSDFVASTSFDALPHDVVERSKWALLDACSAMAGGAETPVARTVACYHLRLGGQEEATVLGHSAKLPAVAAALTNAVAAHALEIDDGHRLAAAHPGAVVVPAALAVAEREQVLGRELLRAVALAYELFIRLATVLNPAHVRRGFHTTATVGPIGSVTASALLAGLDRDRFPSAYALAGIQGAGLLESLHDGVTAKPFQVGRASSGGVLAADLARLGADGPRSVLEGGDGLLRAMSGDSERAAELTSALGERWAIRDTYFKRHASCRHTHSAIDACLDLRARESLDPQSIQEVSVYTSAVGYKLCGSSRFPAGPDDAKFSFPFTVALALECGTAGPQMFTPSTLAHPQIRALARRVKVHIDDELDALYPLNAAARVELSLSSGKFLSAEVRAPLGDPDNPISWDVLVAKHGSLSRSGDPVALIREIKCLDNAPTCTRVIALLDDACRASDQRRTSPLV